MSPIRYLPTTRDVDPANPTVIESTFPTPTSTIINPYVHANPVNIPNWVGIVGLVLFACIVALQFYWTLTRSPKIALEAEQWEVDKMLADDVAASAARSMETLVDEKTRGTAIALPARAYTAAADNAAPGSEDALFHRMAINTLNNQRRSVQVMQKPVASSSPSVPLYPIRP